MDWRNVPNPGEDKQIQLPVVEACPGRVDTVQIPETLCVGFVPSVHPPASAGATANSSNLQPPPETGAWVKAACSP